LDELSNHEKVYLASFRSTQKKVSMMVERFNLGGKSGMPLYITPDSCFLVKLMTDAEFDFVTSFAKEYTSYMQSHRDSLLLKIYGLYTIKMRDAQKEFGFIVMGNVTPTSDGLLQKYDLKGSTYGRKERRFPGDAHGTLLDMDYLEDMRNTPDENESGLLAQVGSMNHVAIVLSKQDKILLMKACLEDVKFLAAHGVMDYSLLAARFSSESELSTTLFYDPTDRHDRYPCFKGAHPQLGEEQHFYCFGIIDISQDYAWYKRAERLWKTGIKRNSADTVSTSPPGFYALRFLTSLNSYLLPSLESDVQIMGEILAHNWDQYD